MAHESVPIDGSRFTFMVNLHQLGIHPNNLIIHFPICQYRSWSKSQQAHFHLDKSLLPTNLLPLGLK